MGTSDGPARGEPSLGPGRANLLRFGGGLLISTLLLVLLFSNIDADQLAASWQRVSLLGALAAVVIHGLSLALRVRRWRGLLEVSDCAPGAASSPQLVWDSAFFGWLVNLVLPARLGELARPLMYSGGSGHPFPRVLGTSLIERAADLATVALLGFAALTMLPGSELLPPWLPQVVWGGAGVAGAGLLLAGIVARRSAAQSAVRRSRFFEVAARLREGFASLHQPRAIARLSAESLGIWLLEVASVWVVLVTFGHPAPLNLAFVHVVAVTLMVSVVTLPFGLGVEQGTTVGLLGFWGISRPDALALSLVLTFSALAWVIPGGLWAWWRQGAGLGRR